MEQTPTFSATAASMSAEPAQPVVEPVASPEVDTTSVDTQEVVQDVADTTEQASPSFEEAVTFEGRLKSRGFDLSDEVDQETLYDQAIERIIYGTQALQELERVRGELEALKATQVSAAPQAPQALPEQPTAAEVHAAVRAFQELKPYDPQLNVFVTRDERGQAVPRPEYGQSAVEAARAINEFTRLEREQAEMLLRNPYLAVQDYMPDIERKIEEKAQALIEARMKSVQDEQAKREQEYWQQAQQEQAYAKRYEWHNTNKSKIFKLGPDGKELKLPFSDDPALTPVGAHFMNRLNELIEELPGADQVALQGIALREAELAVQPKEPSKTPAQQRAEFIQQRSAVVPNQDVPPATIEELEAHRSSRLRFADLSRRLPENEPIVNGWQQR